MRGIAALMVFGHHVQLPGLHPATIGLDAGVLIFFSLSGAAPWLHRPVHNAVDAQVRGAQ